MLLTPYLAASLFCQPFPSKYCCQVMFLSLAKLVSFFLVLIETDADDFEAFRMMFLVSLDYIRQFVNARYAPGRPKVDEHHFAFVVGDRERLAGNIFFVKVRKLAAGNQAELNLFPFGLAFD